MTTIATDGHTMAGDGLVVSGSTVFGVNLQKVHRLKDGRLVGLCGSGYAQRPFMTWLEDGGDKPKLAEGFEAIVLLPDGTCRSYDENCDWLPEEVPSACGSGRQIAIGAMEAGKTPLEAVEIAARRNTETGGTITVLHLSANVKAVA